MTDHSILSPSSAARRVACPGSRLLESQYPRDSDDSAAREGTAAHWVAAEMLTGISSFPALAPNGEPVTKEMIEDGQLYADYILGISSRAAELHIEERIDISIIHPDCWGTPDCWYFNKYIKELHVFDYKYGHGLVETFENWQLIEYTAGILTHLGLLLRDRNLYASRDPQMRVSLHIIQPRNFHASGPVRVWNTTAGGLLEYFSKLKAAEHDAMQPVASCTPSPECTYCSARHVCSALQDAALTACDVSMMNVADELQPLGVGAELRYLLRAAELLDARVTGLSQQALSLIKGGKRVPGFTVEETVGRERWKIPADEVKALGDLFSHNLLKPAEPITPKQAISAGIPEKLVRTRTERSRGAIKLVPETSGTARNIFGGKK